MKVEIDRGAEVVTKRPETDADAARLQQEARVLNAARHPGIVQMLGLPPMPGQPVMLRLRAVAARPLAGLSGPDGWRLGPEEVALVGVAAATTLADLHDLGIVHGGVSADHILVDDRLQPVLCSLGRGCLAAGAANGGPAPADDVSGLASALLGCLPPIPGPGPGPGRQGIHSILVRASRGDRRRPITARRLADQLALVAAPAPGPPPAGAPTGAARFGWVLASVAATLAAAALLVRPGTTRHAATGPGCPTVDLGCRPVPHPDGVVSTDHGRYLIGGPGDPVVIGRWRCSRPLPAVMPQASGNVWAFDQWPAAGLKIAGRLVAHVDGAVSLTVEPAAGGCDRMLVRRRVGPAVDVDPGRQGP